jgi:thiol-disulfide isomerase/thioredoxin
VRGDEDDEGGGGGGGELGGAMACMILQAGCFSIQNCLPKIRSSFVTPELTSNFTSPPNSSLSCTSFFHSAAAAARNVEHCCSSPSVASSVVVSDLGFGRKQRKEEDRRIVARVGSEQYSGVESLITTQTSVRRHGGGGGVGETCKDTFWSTVEEAGEDTVVVLDMFTQWCGPCKLIAPKVEELSYRYKDVIFLKLDCNQENKPLAKELGIRVVPTFKILQNKKVVAEVVGAKFDDLVAAIDKVRPSPKP